MRPDCVVMDLSLRTAAVAVKSQDYPIPHAIEDGGDDGAAERAGRERLDGEGCAAVREASHPIPETTQLLHTLIRKRTPAGGADVL
jgi:hypothetical protein